MALRFNESTGGKSMPVTQHARIIVKAKPGEKYFLIDENTGKTPQDLEVFRHGDKLVLKSPGNDVEIVIEEFWGECRPGELQCFAIFDTPAVPGGELTGQTVITQEGPVLDVLLAGEIGTLGDSGMLLWSAVAGGALGLAAIAAAANGGGRDGEQTPTAPDTTAPVAPGLTANANGSVTVKPADDDTGKLLVKYTDASGKEQSVELNKKADGTWESAHTLPAGVTLDAASGVATITEKALKDGVNVTGTAYDKAGNTASASVTPVNLDPGTPRVELLGGGDDGVINAAESGQISAKITLPEGSKPGDVLHVDYTGAGKADDTHILTAADIAKGSYVIDIPKAAVPANGTLTVTAKLTDSGNATGKEGKAEAQADLTAPAVTVTPVGDANKTAAEAKAGIVTIQSEAGSTSTVTLAGSKGTVTKTVAHNGGDQTVTLSDADIQKLGDGAVEVSVTTKDAAGNATVTPDGNDGDFTLDTTIADALTISFPQDSNGDGKLTSGASGAAEAAFDAVVVKVKVEFSPAKVQAGDVLTVKDHAGNERTVTLSADDATRGSVEVAFPKPAEDGTLTVTAAIKDAAGNSFANNTGALLVVNLLPPGTPTVAINADQNNDGFINKLETGGVTTTSVTVTFPQPQAGDAWAAAKAGDTLTLFAADGTTVLAFTALKPADITAGSYTFSGIGLPASGEIKVKVQLKDAHGTVDPGWAANAPGNDAAVMDLTSPTVAISANPATTLKIGETATVTFTLSEAVNGFTLDDVTVSGGVLSGFTKVSDTTYTATFTPTANAAGSASIAVDADKFTDAANNGNTAGSAIAIAYDTQEPTSTVVLDDGSDSGVKGDNITNDTTPMLTGTTKLGAAVKVEINGKTYDATADGSGKWSVSVPDALPDGVYIPKVTVTDTAGNTATINGAPLIIDTAIGKPAVALADASDSGAKGDNTTNDVTPTLEGKVEAGATVTVAINGKTYTDKADDRGAWHVTVPDADKLNDGSHTATVTVTDAAGNTATNTLPLTIKTTAPGKPVLVGGSAEGTLNAAEAKADGGIKGTATDAKGGTATLVDAAGNPITGKNGKPIQAAIDADGGFTLPTDQLPADGRYLVDVADVAGNRSTEDVPIIVDRSAPDNPVVTVTDNVEGITGKIAANGLTNDGKPVLSGNAGSAEAGGTVTVTVGGHTLTTTIQDDGSWSIAPVDALADGTHTATVTVTDKAGNTGSPHIFPFVVDTAKPNVPTIATVAGDDTINAAEAKTGVIVSGTAEAGSTVKVHDESGNLIGTVTATGNGKWSMNLTPAQITAMGQGVDKLTATATDAAGNTSAADSKNIFVDTAAPAKPDAVTVTDDVAGGVYNGAIANGGITNDNRPTFTGKVDVSENAGTVTVSVNGQTLTAQIGPDGTWGVTPDTALPDGTHTATVTIKDKAGNVSEASAAVSFTVQTIMPAPTIDMVAGDNTINAAEAAEAGAAGVAVSGSAKAGSKVEVRDASNNLIGTVTAESDGKWSMNLTPAQITAMGQGADKLVATATATDAAGNSKTAEQAISVDTVAPGQPVISFTQDTHAGTSDGKLDGNELADVNTSVTVNVKPGAGTVAGDRLTITDNMGGTKIVVLTAADIVNGVTYSAKQPEEDGKLTITAGVQDAAGNTAPAATGSVTIDRLAPATPTVKIVADANGDGYVNANEMPANGKSDVRIGWDAEHTPKVGDTIELHDRQGNTLGKHTVTAGDLSAGAYVFKDVLTLTHSTEFIVVTAKINGGDPGVDSVVVDTAKPAKVTFIAYDDVPAVTGNIQQDGTTNDTTPTFNGKVDSTEAGGTITVTVGGQTLTTPVAADGNWRVTAAALKDGAQTATVTLTDQAGNISEASTLDFTVDTTAPGAPTLTHGSADGILNAADAKADGGIKGTATDAAGGTATLVDSAGNPMTGKDGKPIQATIGADGSFTLPVGQLSADDPYFVDVADKAGNHSTADAPIAIDTTPPAKPTVDKVAGDNIINTDETRTNQPLTGTAEAGSKVEVHDASGNLIGTTTAGPDGKWNMDLTPEHITAMGEGADSLTITATDTAGNSSQSDPLAISVDTTAPAGTLRIDPITGDNLISAAEAGGTVAVSGKVTGEYRAGDVVTLKIGGQNHTANVQADGTFSVDVPGSSLKVDTDRVIEGSALLYDAAGNTAAVTTTHSYGMEAMLDGTPYKAVDLKENGLSQTFFQINLKPSAGVTQLAYKITGGTAKEGEDFSDITFTNGVTYDATTGILTIPAHVSTFNISYTVKQDSLTEGNETITATIGAHEVTPTIPDTSKSVASIAVKGSTKLGAQEATAENDSSAEGVLTYTVTLNKPAAMDVTVTVKLGGTATVPGQVGADYVVGGLSNGSMANGDTVSVVIPAGQSSASFTVDPTQEENIAAFTGEPNETVNAVLMPSGNYIINGDANGAQGIIIDSNPKAMKQLTGDMGLLVGPDVGDFENGGFNTAQKPPAEGGVTTTNYDDIVYVGHYQNGDVSGYGDISAVGALIGAGGLVTDNNRSITTIDLAKGNDILRIHGVQNTNTRVYLGEGNDTYTVGATLGAYNSGAGTIVAYAFTEAGNDTITTEKGGVWNAAVYMGSGSDTINVNSSNGLVNALIDLGSGKDMPEVYLKHYADGTTSLGNDNNTDLATDANTVHIKGQVDGKSSIHGGAGKDNVTVGGNVAGLVELGGNADTLTAGSLNGTVNMGAGADMANITAMSGGTVHMGEGDDLAAITTLTWGILNLGAGNDTLTVGTLKNAAIDMGDGDDMLTITGSNQEINVSGNHQIKGGAGTDTLKVTGSGVKIWASELFGMEIVDLGKGGDKDANTFATTKEQYSGALDIANGQSAMYIRGDALDTVDLGTTGLYNAGAVASWKEGNTAVAADGHTYTAWTIGGTGASQTIYIEQGINVI